MNRFIAFFFLVPVLLSMSSCAAPVRPQLTCAPIGIRAGKKTTLSRAEFSLIEPKLSAYLAERRLVLISDPATADRLATIKYEPNPVTPGSGALQVLDIASNPLKSTGRARIGSDLPISASADAEVNREKAGFIPDWKRD